MISACAILAVYNEADIIREAVSKLIDHGIDVYLIDDASTDSTIDQVQDLVGRGIVDVENVQFLEDGREVFNLSAQLKLKEQISYRLGYDWYLHVDADEIRYSPWPDLSLREGLDRVDKAGYNLVNFKIFNFRLTHNTTFNDCFESSMLLYSEAERFQLRHVKAWKAHPTVDIACLGGHQIMVPDARIFPTRFILKHYPVRSLEHGRRKILAERKNRFSSAERQRGWHVQYDHLKEIDPKDVFWESDQLEAFDLERECLSLLTESNNVLCETMREITKTFQMLDESSFSKYWSQRLQNEGIEFGRVLQLFGVVNGLLKQLSEPQDLPPIKSNPEDALILQMILGSLARMRFLSGDPLIYSRLQHLRFC